MTIPSGPVTKLSVNVPRGAHVVLAAWARGAMTWETVRDAPTASVHVRPLWDLVDHTLTEDCICGPTVEPVERVDGGISWLVSHHSLDGREHREPDHDRAACPLCEEAT